MDSCDLIDSCEQISVTLIFIHKASYIFQTIEQRPREPTFLVQNMNNVNKPQQLLYK
jgi:hypothetical protein